jgi:hypothetical protein
MMVLPVLQLGFLSPDQVFGDQPWSFLLALRKNKNGRKLGTVTILVLDMVNS